MTIGFWLLLAAFALIGSLIGVGKTLYMLCVPIRVQAVVAMVEVVVLVGVFAALVVVFGAQP